MVHNGTDSGSNGSKRDEEAETMRETKGIEMRTRKTVGVCSPLKKEQKSRRYDTIGGRRNQGRREIRHGRSRSFARFTNPLAAVLLSPNHSD
jgi:hypothetical protein